MSSFTIKASPDTDIWRKPPSTDVFTAPRGADAGSKTTAPLSSFKSARVSFLLYPKEQYDQAGLVLSFKSSGASGPLSGDSPPKWLKTGVEYYNGVPKAATVACDSWADWSLADVVKGKEGDWVTVLVENGQDVLGKSFWIYQVVDGEKVPLREVCWVFGHGDPEKWEISVEAYACRPAKEAGDLVVEFKDFDVQWT
ncbi:hypothetical protein J7T55_013001 [Diaporthe amygdali]|uniref:uncharacterized protein n=1 Tax=Phomopsis amygdali TaxID=1214568 RepID=UPI0022FEE628|nr:uncharacterized protein J7T55_013001 [Diaporthe amygdali]KAJ0118747.1 hypothetical protein J7T55_013001 [Diaporthe amygdali]